MMNISNVLINRLSENVSVTIETNSVIIYIFKNIKNIDTWELPIPYIKRIILFNIKSNYRNISHLLDDDIIEYVLKDNLHYFIILKYKILEFDTLYNEMEIE